MEKLKLNKLHIRIALILCAVLLMLAQFGFIPGSSYAEDSYSIIDDFANTDLDISKYPEVSDNKKEYEVVQIAENVDNGLLVYVYQPNMRKDMLATSIRISTGINANILYKDYDLELVGSSSTLFKYLVKGFTVLPDSLRYYAIACIHRAWKSGIDDKSDNSNEINEIAFNVSQLWTVCTINGEVSYSKTENKTIDVTGHRAGCYEFSTSTILGGNYVVTEDFYIAFSTDVIIEKLQEADVEFAIEIFWCNTNKTVSISERKFVTVSADDHSSAQDGYWAWADKYSWSKIETTEAFVNRLELDDTAKKEIKALDWVLHFHEIKNTYNDLTNKQPAVGYRPYGTTILRLKYETAGKSYNMGVVDNKQSGSHSTDNPKSDDPLQWLKDILTWIKDNWYWLIIGAVGIFALIMLVPFLPAVLSFVVQLFVWLFKSLAWLVCLPFKGIAALIGLIKSKKDGSS